MTEPMKFSMRGRPMLPEPYHLRSLGLPKLFLLNGVTIEDDPEHGELVSIDNIQGLYRAIGLHIVAKPSAMTGVEFRFLRKQMGLTQQELAERMGVTDQTIANYEKGKTAPAPAIAHMRLLYVVHVLPAEASARMLKKLTEMMKQNGFEFPELQLQRVSEGWRRRPEPTRACR